MPHHHRAMFLILLAAQALPCVVTASQMPPNGRVSVAYQQRTQGKLSESVHQIELQCWDGACSLMTLTLNQCMDVVDTRAFYPRVLRTSTVDGDLKIVRSGDGFLEAEETLAEARFLHRFSYKAKVDPTLARQLGLRTTSFFGPLTAYSGSAVKSSEALGKVISWDLVPLSGSSVYIDAKCKIMVDGVPE